MTPKDRIFWALQQFIFTLRLQGLCKDGNIASELFTPEKMVRTWDGQQIRINEWNNLSKDSLITVAKNNTLLALGGSVIVVDEALTIAHSPQRQSGAFDEWKYTPTDLNALREVIYLIRCAYAHHMIDVHWNISNGRKSAIYKIKTPDGIQVEFDARDKNKTKLHPDHFGGLAGYFALVNFAFYSVSGS